MYLLIDVGNTRIKWLLVHKNYDETQAASYGSLEEFIAYIENLNSQAVNVVLAAVNQSKALTEALLKAGFKDIEIVVTKADQLGVHNSYQQPERMGVDRWLAMIAAYASAEKKRAKGVVVVDAGSALTIDVVDALGNHLGGYIVPGLQMAQRALFSNTERVIQYEESKSSAESETPFNNLGNNTLQCVEYGVINQLVALVQMVIGRYSNYDVVFTGGDGELVASYFSAATVDKNLVLKGLWQVRK